MQNTKNTVTKDRKQTCIDEIAALLEQKGYAYVYALKMSLANPQERTPEQESRAKSIAGKIVAGMGKRKSA